MDSEIRTVVCTLAKPWVSAVSSLSVGFDRENQNALVSRLNEFKVKMSPLKSDLSHATRSGSLVLLRQVSQLKIQSN